MSIASEPSPQHPARATEPLGRWIVLALLSIILLLAGALRFWGITAQSIWYDEGWSIHLTQQPLRHALSLIGSQGHSHPPGYYMLLLFWERLFGHGVLAMRGLSALIGVLTVAAVYRLGRVLYGPLTGLVGAGLLALAPAHIVYSQEVRMYGLLLLALALLLGLYYEYAHRRDAWGPGHWAALVAVEILAVYTHYFAFFALIAMALWLTVHLARQARDDGWAPLGRWVASQALVFVAFLPWLGTALARVADHTAQGAVAPGAPAFLRDVWTFLLGGHIALAGRESAYGVASLVLLGAVTVASLWLLTRREGRRPTLYLLVQTLLPLLLVFGLMQVRPGFHPRYVLMLLVSVVLLLAGALVRLWRHPMVGQGAAVVLVALWLGTTGLAGHALITDPYYARDDVRAVADYFHETLSAGDLALVDYDGWALRYYLEDTPFDVSYLDPGQYPDDVVPALEALVSAHRRVALLDWHQGEAHNRGLLQYVLARAGVQVECVQLPAYTVHHYWIDDDEAPRLSRQANVNIGPLLLGDMDVETWVPADETLAVALSWRLTQPAEQAYKVGLQVVDAAGRAVARSDQLMVDAHDRTTDQWAVGQEVVTYQTIDLTPGTPPLSYNLDVVVYTEDDPSGLDVLDEVGAPAGKRYRLAEIELQLAAGRTAETVPRDELGLTSLDEPATIAPGLQLNAYALGADRCATGEALPVLLEWEHVQRDGGELADYWPELQLVRDERPLARQDAAPVYDLYPTSWWQPGEVVLDWRELFVPPELAGGPAEVRLRVPGEAPVTLGTVEIEAVPRTFEAPAPQYPVEAPLGELATLVGYDLEPLTIRAGQPIDLTLYWRAQGNGESARATEYVVFTHLLAADGRLIAQHDGPPAGGERPTTGWVQGEYIADSHRMTWVDDGYRGEAFCEVGLYDPQTGERLTTPHGDTEILLPTLIDVIE